MKWRNFACIAALGALPVTAYVYFGDRDLVIPSHADRAAEDQSSGRAWLLNEARRSCEMKQLNAFIDEQRKHLASPGQDPDSHRLYAEALLERVLLRNHRCGVAVGKPLYDEVPTKSAADIEDALQMLAVGREHGDDTTESFRIEAALLSNRITGWASALQWNGKIQRALQAATAKDPQNPALQMALGMRRLLAPRLLGHDPQRAIEHFEFAANAMPQDERPSLFAAMGYYLLEDHRLTIARLEQAVACNSNNLFARAVLARVRRGEPDPFGRDVMIGEAK